MDDLLTAPAEVWCSKCIEPSAVERTVAGETRAFCLKHDPTPAPRLVPDAITDPWLRKQFAQATGAIDPRDTRPEYRVRMIPGEPSLLPAGKAHRAAAYLKNRRAEDK